MKKVIVVLISAVLIWGGIKHYHPTVERRPPALTAERDQLDPLVKAAIGTPFDRLDTTNRIAWIVIDPQTTFVDHQIYDELTNRWIWEIVLTKPGLTRHMKCLLPGYHFDLEQVILLDSQGNTMHRFQW